MKKQLTAFELSRLVEELQLLVGAKLDKVFNPDKKSLLIQFYTKQHGKQIVHILAPNLLYLSQTKEECAEPSGLAMHLRKLLVNSRLKFVHQIGFERIIEFVFDVLEDGSRIDYFLFVELFSTGNIVLVKNNKVIAAAEYRVYSTRAIKPGEQYVCPVRSTNFLMLTHAELSQILRVSSRESVVKVLALDIGLGGVYAEELCLIAGIDKCTKFLGAEDTEKLFGAIAVLKNRATKGIIVKDKKNTNVIIDVVSIDLGVYAGYEKEEFATFNSALSRIASIDHLMQLKESPYDHKIKKVLQVIEEQKMTVAEYEACAEEGHKKAELLYEHFSLVESLLADINTARKTSSWDAIKTRFKDHNLVKEINEKDGLVVIDLNK